MIEKMLNSDESDKEKDNSSKKDALPSDVDTIKSLGSVTTNNSESRIHTLVIAGQIEGHYELPSATKSTKYEHVIPLLVEVEERPEIDGLLIILNTVGGDVEAGLALAELISGMTKPTVSLVLGGGHSIGVPLAVSAKKSFIVPSATMTIHPVRTSGTVIGVPQAFTYLRKMQERISDFIVKNSSISPERLNKLMLETDELAADIGTVIDGICAVDEGLIDKVGSLGEALEELKKMIRSNKSKKNND
ncbi:MAG: ATP-dependent Clp protease proteolytic subunit [Clostridia bacterium]|nr:ATP-dependent Clp protease proteolytic subunit [Clostridia bacterium]